MILITEALQKRFAEVGEQDIPDPIVVAHFFDPCSKANWYVTAYIPEERVIFGWAEVIPGCGEWGYTSIDELECHVGPYGAPIMNDVFWKEKGSSEVEEIHR